MEIFGISLPALLSQLLLGLVNGSFYAILSLGLAVIFGLLNVINFAHGALFMLGALLTWMGMSYLEINYWVMLALAPVLVFDPASYFGTFYGFDSVSYVHRNGENSWVFCLISPSSTEWHMVGFSFSRFLEEVF